MKLYPIISTFVAVFAMVLLFTRSCDPPATPPEDDNLWREKVAMREQVIQTKDSIIASLQALRDEQKIDYRKDSARLERKAAAIFKRYSEAKAQVQQLSDTTGRIAEYVSISDSLLAVKDSTIAVERNNAMVAGKLWQMEVGLIGEKYMQQVEISNEYKARVDQLSGKVGRLEKRLERKRKFNRILLGVAGGLAAVTTLLIIAE